MPQQLKLLPQENKKRDREELEAEEQYLHEISDGDDSSVYSSDEDEDDSVALTEEQEREETLMAKALAKAAFDRTLSNSVLKQLMQPTAASPSKKPKLESAIQVGPLQFKSGMRVTQSEPALATLVNMNPTSTQRSKSGVAVTMKPQEFLKALLAKEGFTLKTVPALSLPSYFQGATEESVKAYSMDITKAVREEDIKTLRALHEQGESLNCSNRFGESIVHIACRRNAVAILKFLMQEAKLTCRVCCDYGRTSLHDACWTSEANFEVIAMLLDDCPDLLYVTDKRGFTALDYVRPGDYSAWCDFLSQRGVEKLLPREVVTL